MTDQTFTEVGVVVVLVWALGMLIMGSFMALGEYIYNYVISQHPNNKKLINYVKTFKMAIAVNTFIWFVGAALLVYGQAHGWFS